MKYANSEGVEHEFRLDVDRIIEKEAEDPEWSLEAELDKLDGNIRLSTLDTLTRFLGCPYKEFVAMGYAMDDLAEIFLGCMASDLGFPLKKTSSETESDA